MTRLLLIQFIALLLIAISGCKSVSEASRLDKQKTVETWEVLRAASQALDQTSVNFLLLDEKRFDEFDNQVQRILNILDQTIETTANVPLNGVPSDLSRLCSNYSAVMAECRCLFRSGVKFAIEANEKNNRNSRITWSDAVNSIIYGGSLGAIGSDPVKARNDKISGDKNWMEHQRTELKSETKSVGQKLMELHLRAAYLRVDLSKQLGADLPNITLLAE
jgi:hypothetical protein